MNKIVSIALCVAAMVGFTACNNGDSEKNGSANTEKKAVSPDWAEENITYTGDGTTMNGFVVYDKNDTSKKPAVLVVPEWWGMNGYAKMRAKELAKLGYVAMAIDVYGNGKTADNPDSAGAYATPFYKDPAKAKLRVDAAIARLKQYPQVDAARIGAVGYCFGGGVLLNTVRLGDELKGIVSFHGSLVGTPARKDLLTADILVCHGGSDPFVPQKEADLFKKQMDSIGAKYTFKVYDSATHAFTNPDATAMGEKFKLPIRYNAKADTASWNDMKVFFTALFKQ
jgi:dienelactone hydrolase